MPVARTATNPSRRARSRKVPQMLRLTELKLPLDHADDALRPALCARLGIAAEELLDFRIAKRSHVLNWIA